MYFENEYLDSDARFRLIKLRRLILKDKNTPDELKDIVDKLYFEYGGVVIVL